MYEKNKNSNDSVVFIGVYDRELINKRKISVMVVALAIAKKNLYRTYTLHCCIEVPNSLKKNCYYCYY